MKQEIKEHVEKIRKGEVPEGYKETKVGIIPEEWLVSLTDNVAKRGTGHTPNKKFPSYYNGGIKWISLQDSNKLDNGLIFHTKVEISEEGLSNSSAVLHPKGSVLISRDAGVGKSAIMGSDMSVSQHFITWTCSNKLNNWYLYYYLQKRKSDFERMAVGSTIKTIGMPFFKKYEIPLPPIKEQEKIVDILSTWDKAIELHEKLIKEKKEFKKGLMQKLLAGKVRFPEFTDDWTEYQLKDICKFMKGSGLSKDKLSINGDKKCILYGELYTTYLEVIQEVKSKTNIVEGVPSQKGDVLIPASTTTSGIDLANATAIEENSVLLGGDINILRNDKSLFNSSFLAHYLTHIKKFDLASKAQGITIVHLYGKHLKKIQINVPQVKEQEKIVQILSIQDDVIEILAEKLLQLKKQKRGLMQLLLAGIVRVGVN